MEGSFHAQPAPGSLPTPHSVTDWTPVSADSLKIIWTSGFTGTVGRFAGHGDTLEGQLRTSTDAPPHPKYRAEATLARVPCSAPPEVPASAAAPGLWFVPLEGGDTVHLGRLLPEELIDRPGENAYRIAGTPTGIFAGARDVRAQLTRGGAVADIQLSYPSDVSIDSLVAAFQDTLGSPASDERQSWGRTEVLWLTKTTTLELRRSDGETYVDLERPGVAWEVPPGATPVIFADSAGAEPGSG